MKRKSLLWAALLAPLALSAVAAISQAPAMTRSIRESRLGRDMEGSCLLEVTSGENVWSHERTSVRRGAYR